MLDGREPNQLTREQKTGFVLLLIFGLLAVGLGALQMRNTIYSPFVIRAAETSLDVALLDEDTRLKQIDTDHDGLVDWDELNVYSTSPYIPDTDSDTVSDKVEIDRGTDPLCPEGKNCAATDAPPTTTSTQFLQSFGNTTASMGSLLDTIGADAGTGDGDVPITAADIASLINNPQALRELLRQSGKIPETTLSKIDNAALIQIANDLVKELPAASPAAGL